MRLISFHAPEPILEAIDAMRKKGLFFSRGEVIRYILISGLSEFLQLPEHALSGNCRGGIQVISIRMPAGLLALADGVRKHLGISRSEFFRTAALNYVQSLRGLRE